MLEVGLKVKDLKRLEKLLPKYIDKRSKGMHAGIIADKLDLPLKDVISFLIEKNVLRDEQVDLELTRVILAKNLSLRESIVRRVKLTYDKLDHALATQDEQTLKEAIGRVEINEMYVLLPQFVVFFGVLQFPYAIALMLFTTLVTLLLNGTLQRMVSLSVVETVMRMLKNG